MIGRVRPWILISIWMAVIPLWVPANLKVHVAEEVFQALDIGQGLTGSVIVCLSGHQAAGNSGHGMLLMGTPAAIRDSVDAQTLAWDVEPVGLHVSRTRYGLRRGIPPRWAVPEASARSARAP